ncbi:MAG: hypothetical protein ACYCV7_08920 [Acidimicrobiales bacterium]
MDPSAWKSVRIDRAGRYRRTQLHEDVVSIKDIARPVRQIAVRNIGRDNPTLLITADSTTLPPSRDSTSMHSPRGWPSTSISTPPPVIAGSLLRLFDRSLKRYEHTTPERLYDHFIDTTGTVYVDTDHVTVELKRRTWTPILRQAGYAEMDLAIPWWEARRLRFRFR